jgi:hypothetical protein
MAKPSTFPRWAETAGGVPAGNLVSPTSGEQDTGYPTGGFVPTSGKLNWLFNTILQWLKWLNEAASAATASALMVRDAGGRAKVANPGAADDIDTQGARDTAIGVHAALTTTHGSTPAASANMIMQRDANGRAKVADPAAADDVDTRGARDIAIANAAPARIMGYALVAGGSGSVTKGALASGYTGWAISRLGTGHYQLRIDTVPPAGVEYLVKVMPYVAGGAVRHVVVDGVAAAGMDVTVYDGTGTAADTDLFVEFTRVAGVA